MGLMTTLQCPHCQKVIDIDDVLKHQLQEQVQKEFAAKELALQQEQKQLRQKLIDVTAQNEQQLKQKEQQIKQELWARAQEEATKKVQAATQEQAEKLKREMSEQLTEQKTRAEKAEAAEIELRKLQRQLTEEKKQSELRLERQLDDRLKIELQKQDKLQTDIFHQREQEYLKQIQDMRKSVEEAQRKSTTVSQQLQGEVQELELQSLLAAQFPHDHIEEIKKGQLGADIIQTVRTPAGKEVGIIVWESKQTSAFSDKWLSKLREDSRSVRGSVAVLVTNVMPSDLTICAQREGVWITQKSFALPLAELLRQTLLKVDQEKLIQKGKDVKADMLFTYISSHEFRSRVEAIVESFKEMHDDLDREQRQLQLMWKKRDKQILRLATNTAYMYGELQGVLGSSLPIIQGLDMSDGSEISTGQMTLQIEHRRTANSDTDSSDDAT